MQIFDIKGVHIDGVVACMPENLIDNESALNELYGEEAKLIIESTGIKNRYLANRGTTTTNLCVAAAKDLLFETNTDAAEIGGIVFVTFTPDRIMPFNAALAQVELGLPNGIPAFDINLACSGYPYGVYIASTLCKASNKKVLLLDGDVQSAHMSGLDKATVPVLSDGGSATLLSPYGEDEWKFTFYTDGGGREVLTIPAGGSESPVKPDDLLLIDQSDGGKRRSMDIYMDGFAVFRFVAVTVSKWLKEFLDSISENCDTINCFVPHQANMYMIRKLAKKLGFSWDRTWQSGDSFGNSASATVAITIAKEAKEKVQNGDCKALISGFGAGLSASAGLVKLYSNAYYNVIKINN